MIPHVLSPRLAHTVSNCKSFTACPPNLRPCRSTRMRQQSKLKRAQSPATRVPGSTRIRCLSSPTSMPPVLSVSSAFLIRRQHSSCLARMDCACNAQSSYERASRAFANLSEGEARTRSESTLVLFAEEVSKIFDRTRPSRLAETDWISFVRPAYTSMLHIATADEKNAAQNAAL